MSESDADRIMKEIYRDIVVLKEKMGYMEERIQALSKIIETLKTTKKEWR